MRAALRKSVAYFDLIVESLFNTVFMKVLLNSISNMSIEGLRIII